MSKHFFDTNILIYSIDQADLSKRRIAGDLIQAVRSDKLQGVVSTQVLQEFATVSGKKFGADAAYIKRFLSSMNCFEIVTVTPEMVQQAVDAQYSTKISFWDALIVTAADNAHCESILSEDLNHGQKIRDVRVENPFKDC